MVIIMLMLLLSVAFLVLLERKLLRRVQLRTGPYNVGWFGILQTIMDRLKLLNKPSAINNKNSFMFLIVILGMSYMRNYYMLMVLMLRRIILIFMGIMIRGNIYGKIGAYRLVVLSWGYDIVLLVMLLNVPKELVMIVVLYYLLSCEVRRTPIDLIEGESELVSGFNTEYSGREFVRFFLREYLRILIFLIIVISVDVMILILLYIIVIYVRGSYPRKKYTEVILSM